MNGTDVMTETEGIDEMTEMTDELQEEEELHHPKLSVGKYSRGGGLAISTTIPTAITGAEGLEVQVQETIEQAPALVQLCKTLSPLLCFQLFDWVVIVCGEYLLLPSWPNS